MNILSFYRLKAERGTGVGAGCLFYCPSTGRYLLVKRSKTCDEPNTWACLGGGVEIGETIEEGLLRECKEEAQFDGRVDLQPMYVSEQPNFTYHNFVGIVDEEFEPVLNHEHTDYVWALPSEFPQPLHPKFEEALQHLDRPTQEMATLLANQPYDYNRRLAKDTWDDFEDYAKGINGDPSTVVQVMGTEVDSCGTLIQPLIQVKSMKINAATRLLASTPEIKFIIRNDGVLDGYPPSIPSFESRNTKDKLAYLMKCAVTKGTGVSQKVGNGSFRDKVDFNSALKSGKEFQFSMERRKGYFVATFR